MIVIVSLRLANVYGITDPLAGRWRIPAKTFQARSLLQVSRQRDYISSGYAKKIKVILTNDYKDGSENRGVCRNPVNKSLTRRSEMKSALTKRLTKIDRDDSIINRWRVQYVLRCSKSELNAANVGLQVGLVQERQRMISASYGEQ